MICCCLCLHLCWRDWSSCSAATFSFVIQGGQDTLNKKEGMFGNTTTVAQCYDFVVRDAFSWEAFLFLHLKCADQFLEAASGKNCNSDISFTFFLATKFDFLWGSDYLRVYWCTICRLSGFLFCHYLLCTDFQHIPWEGGIVEVGELACTWFSINV